MCWKGVLLASEERLGLLQRKMKWQPGLYSLARMLLRVCVESSRSVFVVVCRWGRNGVWVLLFSLCMYENVALQKLKHRKGAGRISQPPPSRIGSQAMSLSPRAMCSLS